MNTHSPHCAKFLNNPYDIIFQTGFAYSAKKSELHVMIITLNLTGWMVSPKPPLFN